MLEGKFGIGGGMRRGGLVNNVGEVMVGGGGDCERAEIVLERWVFRRGEGSVSIVGMERSVRGEFWREEMIYRE